MLQWPYAAFAKITQKQMQGVVVPEMRLQYVHCVLLKLRA